MIQQRPRCSIRSLGPGFALGLGLVAACGPKPPAEIPRRLDGRTQLGAFVPPFAYEAYVRGELLLALGDAAGAARAFELASVAPEEDPYLLSRLAWALALSGEQEAAERTLLHAEQLDGCSEATWLVRAALAERRDARPAARDAFARAAECAPESELGPLGLARTLVSLGEEARAQGVLQAFIERVGSDKAQAAALTLALQRGDALAATDALEGWLSSAPPRQTTLVNAIERALEMGRPMLAERLLEHVVAGAPAALAARVYLAVGELDKARGTLMLASAEALGGPAAAAEMLLDAGLSERAETEASNALLALESPRVRLSRSRARSALGDAPGALEDLQHALRSPQSRAALQLLLERQALAGLSAELGAFQEPAPKAETAQ